MLRQAIYSVAPKLARGDISRRHLFVGGDPARLDFWPRSRDGNAIGVSRDTELEGCDFPRRVGDHIAREPNLASGCKHQRGRVFSEAAGDRAEWAPLPCWTSTLNTGLELL